MYVCMYVYVSKYVCALVCMYESAYVYANLTSMDSTAGYAKMSAKRAFISAFLRMIFGSLSTLSLLLVVVVVVVVVVVLLLLPARYLSAKEMNDSKLACSSCSTTNCLMLAATVGCSTVDTRNRTRALISRGLARRILGCVRTTLSIGDEEEAEE